MRATFDDTIVAIATPLGEGGLGVVRLSGPQAFPIAETLFRSRQRLSQASSHTLHHGWLVRDDRRLDEAVAAVFRGPKSYTGEDVVEFSCHGSPAVLQELLRWCCEAGARLARPGEFTERAFTHGRMDLTQAEAVASLISARSSRAVAAAADQLAGGLSRYIEALRQRTIDLLADIEANLDFAEEDLPNIDKERVTAIVKTLVEGIDELLSTRLRGRVLRDGARVVLAGRPNVGKSSLFNAFLSQNRAIVTDVPGTTRDTLEEALSWDGYPVVLVDTAGLRETSDRVETEGTERARRAVDRAQAVVFVIDASMALTEDDRVSAALFSGKPVVAALNKCDSPAVVTGADAAALGFSSVVAVSAHTGAGLGQLRGEILRLLPETPDTSAEGPIVTNERHAEQLALAKNAAEAALGALGSGRSEEALATDLRRVAQALSEITGVDVGEAVLDSVFRRFCIGK